MKRLLTIGEPLVCLGSNQKDVKLSNVTSFNRFIGGAELNVAVGVRKLGHDVTFIGQVGADPFGEAVVEYLDSRGVDTRYLFKRRGYWTGHQIKDLISKGDPEVYNYRSDSATYNFDANLSKDISVQNYDIAHLTGIFPALSPKTKIVFEDIYQKLLDNNIFVTFDTNLRPALWKDLSYMKSKINEYARHASLVLPGIEEGRILTGFDIPEKIADFYLESSYTELVVIKLGSQGAYIKGKNCFEKNIKGFKVTDIKDTVGAGDGFAVGVLTGIMEGLSIEESVLRGNAIGAMQVQVYGDNTGYPDIQRLKDFYVKYNV